MIGVKPLNHPAQTRKGLLPLIHLLAKPRFDVQGKSADTIGCVLAHTSFQLLFVKGGVLTESLGHVRC